MPAPTVAPKRPAGQAAAPQRIPAIPFERASRVKTQLAFDTGAVALSATAQTVLNPVPLPAAGFLKYVDLDVIGNATNTGAAAVAFVADGPFSAISQISMTNAAGDSMIVPVTGYQLMLMNKYGIPGKEAPWIDPRKDVNYSATTGTSTTLGGDFRFKLRVPIEVDPRDAFCAISNSAANKRYSLNIMLAALSSIYSVQPASATLQISATLGYWSIPGDVNAKGIPQESSPRGLGSVSAWRLQSPPLTPGAKTLDLTNVGGVLRCAILTLRNNVGARVGTTDWPAIASLILNNDVMYYLPQSQWESDMAEAYGYTDTTTRDVAGGLDTGVYAIWQWMAQRGKVQVDSPRDQWLPTAEGTMLQFNGTSWGANASTLEVLTNEVRPVSAAALYSANVV